MLKKMPIIGGLVRNDWFGELLNSLLMGKGIWEVS